MFKEDLQVVVVLLLLSLHFHLTDAVLTANNLKLAE